MLFNLFCCLDHILVYTQLLKEYTSAGLLTVPFFKHKFPLSCSEGWGRFDNQPPVKVWCEDDSQFKLKHFNLWFTYILNQFLV